MSDAGYYAQRAGQFRDAIQRKANALHEVGMDKLSTELHQLANGMFDSADRLYVEVITLLPAAQPKPLTMRRFLAITRLFNDWRDDETLRPAKTASEVEQRREKYRRKLERMLNR